MDSYYDLESDIACSHPDLTQEMSTKISCTQLLRAWIDTTDGRYTRIDYTEESGRIRATLSLVENGDNKYTFTSIGKDRTDAASKVYTSAAHQLPFSCH